MRISAYVAVMMIVGRLGCVLREICRSDGTDRDAVAACLVRALDRYSDARDAIQSCVCFILRSVPHRPTIYH